MVKTFDKRETKPNLWCNFCERFSTTLIVQQRAGQRAGQGAGQGAQQEVAARQQQTTKTARPSRRTVRPPSWAARASTGTGWEVTLQYTVQNSTVGRTVPGGRSH